MKYDKIFMRILKYTVAKLVQTWYALPLLRLIEFTGGLIREINKAFCGFSVESRHAKCEMLSEGSDRHSTLPEDFARVDDKSMNHSLVSNSMLDL